MRIKLFILHLFACKTEENWWSTPIIFPFTFVHPNFIQIQDSSRMQSRTANWLFTERNHLCAVQWTTLGQWCKLQVLSNSSLLGLIYTQPKQSSEYNAYWTKSILLIKTANHIQGHLICRQPVEIGDRPGHTILCPPACIHWIYYSPVSNPQDNRMKSIGMTQRAEKNDTPWNALFMNVRFSYNSMDTYSCTN